MLAVAGAGGAGRRLLGHARREDPEAVRGGGTDLVSGMLTAIRSFVRDSFGPGNDAAAGGESGELSEFTFGEHEVTIAEGAKIEEAVEVVLAALAERGRLRSK